MQEIVDDEASAVLADIRSINPSNAFRFQEPACQML